MNLSKIGSRALFAISVALLSGVVYFQFFYTGSRGEWRSGPQGEPVVGGNLTGPDGADAEIEHPALLLFLDDDCRFCTPAENRLAEFVRQRSERRVSSLRIYRLARDPNYPSSADSNPLFPLLTADGANPSLKFVTEVPTFVRTDEDGLVQDAFVGIPDRSILRRLTGARAGDVPASEGNMSR